MTRVELRRSLKFVMYSKERQYAGRRSSQHCLVGGIKDHRWLVQLKPYDFLESTFAMDQRAFFGRARLSRFDRYVMYSLARGTRKGPLG